MTKLKREAKTLKEKALHSLKRGICIFNSYDNEGRVTSTLLHFQHASEMIIKSILVQNKIDVFDKQANISIGFGKSLRHSQAIGVTPEEAGTLRAIDSLRDAAQHWIIFVDEQILYLHARALVTIFDELLKRFYSDDLVSHLPARVLPVSSMPPATVELLIDRQYSQISELLKPGRRARDEARGRIRALLALESHVADEVKVSERDIDRIETGIRLGKDISQVFPRLQGIDTNVTGHGINVQVHFTKRQGAPVRFVAGNEPEAAAAVREVDLQKKYYMGRKALAKKLSITEPSAKALREHLKIDGDQACMHTFKHGRSEFPSYSDNALNKMKEVIVAGEMPLVWNNYQASKKEKKVCA